MSIGLAAAAQGVNTLHFELCPNWDSVAKKCACPTAKDGTLVMPHPTFDYGARPSTDTRTDAQWALDHLVEAKRLVGLAQSPAVKAATLPAPITALVGTTL